MDCFVEMVCVIAAVQLIVYISIIFTVYIVNPVVTSAGVRKDVNFCEI